MQSKLSSAAKRSLDRKFGALYDKVYREDVVMEAWLKVRANRGAPGIDQQDFDEIEQVVGVTKFLTEIREELRSYRYRPKAVLRCWIDKPGKPDKRPLGIPCIKDRVIQMAVVSVIEPIFETNFLNCSHGFRSGRSPHTAIDAIRRGIVFDYMPVRHGVVQQLSGSMKSVRRKRGFNCLMLREGWFTPATFQMIVLRYIWIRPDQGCIIIDNRSQRRHLTRQAADRVTICLFRIIVKGAAFSELERDMS